jgi:4-nitrophenyl phosphatase
MLATNNTLRPPEELAEDLQGIGILVDPSRIITSAEATGFYLRQHAPRGARVFIVGEDGIRQAILRDGLFTEDAHHPEFVIVGLDRQLTYEKIRLACMAIRRGAQFIGTNPDLTLPLENGEVAPGAGTCIAAVQACAGQTPITIGKPGPILYELAMSRLQVVPHHVVAVGDRLETDIAGATAAGIRSVLVLTGISSREEATSFSTSPTFIVRDLHELMALLAP